jgi:hypothetical protein
MISGGIQDQWADPKVNFWLVLPPARYILLGIKGICATEMPAPNVAWTDGDLAYREHNGGHSDLPDWPVFITLPNVILSRGERAIPPVPCFSITNRQRAKMLATAAMILFYQKLLMVLSNLT